MFRITMKAFQQLINQNLNLTQIPEPDDPPITDNGDDIDTNVPAWVFPSSCLSAGIGLAIIFYFHKLLSLFQPISSNQNNQITLWNIDDFENSIMRQSFPLDPSAPTFALGSAELRRGESPQDDKRSVGYGLWSMDCGLNRAFTEKNDTDA